MDIEFLGDTLMQLLPGVPLTLELAIGSVALGFFLALLLALMRLSGVWILDNIARLYVFTFSGSPLLVQMFLIYYGRGNSPPYGKACCGPFCASLTGAHCFR